MAFMLPPPSSVNDKQEFTIHPPVSKYILPIMHANVNKRKNAETKLTHSYNGVAHSFPNQEAYMWASSYEANSPSEDRHASLVNVILKNPSEIIGKGFFFMRMLLWCVLDGHGGGKAASYASEVLLPHIAKNISSSLHSKIVSRGVFTVNGEVRDINALNLDNLLTLSQPPIHSSMLSSRSKSKSSDSDPYSKRQRMMNFNNEMS